MVGPLDRSKLGYAYLLTAMDLTTHFTYALPMKGYTAEETAWNLIDMGPPSQILTNQCQNFMSNVFKQVTDKFAITRIRTSPYHPECNGTLERFHLTLKSALRNCCVNKRDWPEVLDLALYYLRNVPHRISSFTPFELQYGKQTPTILTTLKSYWLDSEDTQINITDFMLNLQKYISHGSSPV